MNGRSKHVSQSASQPNKTLPGLSASQSRSTGAGRERQSKEEMKSSVSSCVVSLRRLVKLSAAKERVACPGADHPSRAAVPACGCSIEAVMMFRDLHCNAICLRRRRGLRVTCAGRLTDA